MKFLALPLIALTMLGSAAVAQPNTRTVVVERTTTHHTGYRRKHRVCRTKWVNHHRVKRCTWR